MTPGAGRPPSGGDGDHHLQKSLVEEVSTRWVAKFGRTSRVQSSS